MSGRGVWVLTENNDFDLIQWCALQGVEALFWRGQELFACRNVGLQKMAQGEQVRFGEFYTDGGLPAWGESGVLHGYGFTLFSRRGACVIA